MITGTELESINNIEKMISNTLKIYENEITMLDYYEEQGQDVSNIRQEALKTMQETISTFRRAIDAIRNKENKCD